MLSDNILFVISMFTTILWNKMKYPALPFQENNIQVYDTIPVKSKRLLNFSAGSGYWIYYLGIVKFIQEEYSLENTDFVGTSAGAFSSAVLATKSPIDDVFCYAIQHLERCNQNLFGVFGYWNISYHEAILVCCNRLNVNLYNNCFFGVSKLTSLGFKKQYFDCGTTHNDIAISLLSSCWIPFVTAPFFQPLWNFYGDGFWTGKDLIKHDKQLIIYPNKLERLPLSTYWLWLGKDYNTKLFELGYTHARKHRKIFDEFFA
jgi:hypothetical protein